MANIHKMFFEIEVSKEIQFLGYLVPVIIGVQLAFFFFYQYYKIQDVNLPLNRILLAFGTFIIVMVLGPLFIQISRNFIEKGLLYEVIYRMGWCIAFFSTISVSFFIIKKDFSIIINQITAKILMILNFIPVILVFLVPSIRSPIFLATISFVILNGLYIIRFQLILIKKSVGSIKKKFKLFFIGSIVSLFALIFASLVGLGVLPPIINEIIYFTGISELLIGFIIMSFSVYNFPPFYEFEWRENLSKLFIINQQNKSCLYSCNFIEQTNDYKDSNQSYLYNKDKFFPRGIMGIEYIITIITDTKNERINKINQGDYYIFLEYGVNQAYITYLLVVKKDLISAHHLLKSIRTQFESFFKEILLNLNNLKGQQEKIFGSFDFIMTKIIQQ